MNGAAIKSNTVKDWCIDLKISWNSDHKAIRWTVDYGAYETVNAADTKYSLKGVDLKEWGQRFREELRKREADIRILLDNSKEHTEEEELEKAATALMAAIQGAMETLGKIQRILSQSKPWWMTELEEVANRITRM
jgi:hypothetical protein